MRWWELEMNNHKIKVNDEAESKEAQELFFELGYKWEYKNLGKKVCNEEPIGFLYAEEDGSILSGAPDKFDFFYSDENKELTLPQLRDLVAQSKAKEQGLISGADALRALADGQLVQYSFDDDQYWQADIANLKITDFGSGHFQFRLKPRTLNILGVEFNKEEALRFVEEYFS